MNKSRTVVLLWLLIGCSGGESELALRDTNPWLGLSAFSSMSESFPCEEYLTQVNKAPKPMMPVLWGTFGFDLTCINDFIQSNHDRPHAVEIHFSNERCRFHERCGKGELLGSLTTEEYNDHLEKETGWVLEAIAARAEAVEKVLEALKLPTTTIIVTTGLEDLYTDKAFGVLYNELTKVLPYEIIRSPVEHLTRSTIPLELHGVQVPCPPSTLASNDGNAISVSDAVQYGASHRDCKGVSLWGCSLQGSCGQFTPPLDRTFTITESDVLAWDLFLEGASGEQDN